MIVRRPQTASTGRARHPGTRPAAPVQRRVTGRAHGYRGGPARALGCRASWRGGRRCGQPVSGRAHARETVASVAQYLLLGGFAAVAAGISAQGLTGFARENMGLTGPWPYLLFLALDGAAGVCAVLLTRRAARAESGLAPRLAVWGLVARLRQLQLGPRAAPPRCPRGVRADARHRRRLVRVHPAGTAAAGGGPGRPADDRGALAVSGRAHPRAAAARGRRAHLGAGGHPPRPDRAGSQAAVPAPPRAARPGPGGHGREPWRPGAPVPPSAERTPPSSAQASAIRPSLPTCSGRSRCLPGPRTWPGWTTPPQSLPGMSSPA